MIKAACLSDQYWLSGWPHTWKYPVIVFSEIFVGIAKAISYCLQPKIAREWFATTENTLCQTIVYCGCSLGCSALIFMPYFVTAPDELYKMSHLFTAASVVLASLVVVSITRSKPKLPPSQESITALTATDLPILGSLRVVSTRVYSDLERPK